MLYTFNFLSFVCTLESTCILYSIFVHVFEELLMDISPFLPKIFWKI